MKFLSTALDKKAPWISHGFFTRLGGESAGLYESLNCGFGTKDGAANVAANRAYVANMMELPPENIVSLKQTHSAKAITVTSVWARTANPEGDALVTDRPDIGLGILTADCAPVLFADRKNKIIGAAHAGWKGALGGILEATVAAMEKLGAQKENISAAIGPCIGPQSYEVGDSFKVPFLNENAENEKFFHPATRAGHLFFDLPAFVTARLQKCGVQTVFDTKQDTLPNEGTYFSYRRSCLRGEDDYGRQLSVIAIKK